MFFLNAAEITLLYDRKSAQVLNTFQGFRRYSMILPELSVKRAVLPSICDLGFQFKEDDFIPITIGCTFKLLAPVLFRTVGAIFRVITRRPDRQVGALSLFQPLEVEAQNPLL
jgi:hypothetical protein